MFLRHWLRPASLVGAVAVFAGAGCSGLKEWHANGFKVGPNYVAPVTHVAEQWSPAGTDPRLAGSPADLREWWAGLNDPTLSVLLASAGETNPALRRAALKIVELEAIRGKTKGNLYPQSQSVMTTFVNGTISKNLVQGAFQNKFNIWADGYMASWEFDVWGRYRRAVEAADADLAGSVEAYRDTLAGLLADTASAYIDIRTYQQRIAVARQTVEARRGSLALAESRVRSGTATDADVWKAKMGVAQAEAAIPPLELGLRQAGNKLAVL
ncbi:MAG: TolC family protein, partial [Fimbriiglobus sp.]